MKQVVTRKGQIAVEDVPAPIAGEKEILVRVYYSCISSGTELSALKGAKLPLYKRVLQQPAHIKTALEMIRRHGIEETVARIKSVLDSPHSLGYSASGIVLEVGRQVKDIQPGDRVACAGAGVAHHAEFVTVPRNLLVKIPERVSLDAASTATLGSIALQGIRRADPRLGEFVAVIGLGVLGQLAVQMLKANGCQVIGVDVNPSRVDLALSLGLDKGLHAGQRDCVQEAVQFSGGRGVDSVIITASTESSEVIHQAMGMCRRKGKVIIVGAVGLNLEREPFYAKELDVLISTSYGPGRYDPEYELEGRDYPYAYVRWTENRNMEAYLRLLEDKKIKIKPLIQKIYSVEEAAAAYEELQSTVRSSLMTLLEYHQESVLERKVIIPALKPESKKERFNVAVVGAGSFAQAVHLPNLKKLDNLYRIYAVVSKTGLNVKTIAEQYHAAYAATDFQEVLKDEKVDVVLIATRHHLHASMAMEAARAGKAVFLEKPMAVNPAELKPLAQALEETQVPFLVGYNRRFSPFIQKIKEITAQRKNPLIINYRMNAGFIPLDHWVHSPEGGGRNIGEACHVYDLFNFLTESTVQHIHVSSISPSVSFSKNDNFAVTVKYQDGSLGNLIYTALGTPQAPKEEMEIYCGGKIIRLSDYQKLEFVGLNIAPQYSPVQRKGHYEEWTAFAQSMKGGGGFPIPLWQLMQAAEISFEVERQITEES